MVIDGEREQVGIECLPCITAAYVLELERLQFFAASQFVAHQIVSTEGIQFLLVVGVDAVSVEDDIRLLLDVVDGHARLAVGRIAVAVAVSHDDTEIGIRLQVVVKVIPRLAIDDCCIVDDVAFSP